MIRLESQVGRRWITVDKVALGPVFLRVPPIKYGPGSSVGIATDYELDGPGIESRCGEILRCPDCPGGPPSLLHNGYRVFPGDKLRLGRAVDRSPPSNAAVKKE
jgi:hypothetical protein